MKITIGKNNSACESSVFALQIILSKKRSLNFSINKPVSIEEVIATLKERK